MMKKFVTAAVVAALVGVSSTCLAGFGLPKIGGSSKAPAASAQEEKSAPVDISDITKKQDEILRYMKGAAYAQYKAYAVVEEARGKANPDLAKAFASMKTTSDVKKAKTLLDKSMKDMQSEQGKKDVAAQNVQADKLASAIKVGKVYQQAAIVNYGFVAAHAPAALQEASSAVKNVGKDINAVNKLNGAIATFKLGAGYAADAQEASAKYNDIVDALKGQYGVTDAVMANASAPDVESIAAECLAVVDK